MLKHCFLCSEVQKRIAEEKKKALEAEEKLAKERVEEIRKSYKKAQDSYYEAIEELPKGWDLVVMQVRACSCQAKIACGSYEYTIYTLTESTALENVNSLSRVYQQRF